MREHGPFEQWPEFKPLLGRSPFQRHLHHLGAQGITRVAVVPMITGRLDAKHDLTGVINAQRQALSTSPPVVAVSDAPQVHQLVEHVLVMPAVAVYDARLYQAVHASPAPVRLVDGADDTGLARLARDAMVSMVGNESSIASGAAVPGVPTLDVGALPHYLPALRRHLRPWWCHAASEADRARAGRLLIDAAQKGVLDFPARYLHPWPENVLAKAAAKTRITPNQITVYSALIAFFGTYLFAIQYFLLGLFIAVIAGILDGVDGKLARIKLLSSPFGDRLDHSLDVSFEFSWYIALGWGLSQAAGDPNALWVGYAILLVMILARALCGVYRLVTGHQIHDHTAFDRRVRLVAGRRNIYVLVWLAGALAGNLLVAFYMTLLWAIATVIVYAARILIAFIVKRQQHRRASALTPE
jgi:phosphatidylglycerophosphate synthase